MSKIQKKLQTQAAFLLAGFIVYCYDQNIDDQSCGEKTLIDDDLFIAAIKAAPNNNTPRLVYADWLDEYGRPGGDFLRIECEIANLDPKADDRHQQLLDEIEKAEVMDSYPNIYKIYSERYSELLSNLGSVKKKLDYDWIDTISRIPIDTIYHYERHIQSLIVRRVTVKEALIKVEQAYQEKQAKQTDETVSAILQPKTLWEKLRNYFQKKPESSFSEFAVVNLQDVQKWIEESKQPNDQLWLYTENADIWGYAIVRKEQVVEYKPMIYSQYD